MNLFAKKKDKACNHNFQDKFAIVINDKFPRVVSICSKCGLSIHRKIYSMKEVREVENGEE